MRLLSAKGHALVDWLTAPLLALAVQRARLSEPARSSALMFVPLILLAVSTTRTPLGVVRIVPLRLHGRAEIASVVVQFALPWLRGFSSDRRGRNFMLGFAAYNFAVWLATDWGSTEGK
ncbi:hypothetical protein [Deinococcus yavapaiensis]|uniref:Uncharacterized protein n=1 Tax=Deinococcus yavapaiensis KR-236 TaxID=694435 RepID=A0A318S365_9DEIO|nr:hypothetical protein [Deinococcus yavapaiensis]PYE51865.1 hypothetical protein DES52_11466 [Deinococcus yavapaiensis KR-236]